MDILFNIGVILVAIIVLVVAFIVPPIGMALAVGLFMSRMDRA